MVTLRVTCFALLATGVLASSAYAQNDAKPLNLSVPPSIGFPVAGPASATSTSTAPTGTAPSSSTSANTTPTGTAPSNVNTAPGVYYGDTSGAVVAGSANNPDDATDGCDDATYNKSQVHGSVSTGVVAGNHFSGSYQTGTVNITKPLGDCKHPTGSLSISVSGGQSLRYPH